ncbi:hypothetical protein PoB_003599700 [Plakobranchus ocellatus]|uniref:Uncharacterized protein n=1 Tax=Plakobranchus ocellatus TaxID=259542 RepID=A0AAV4ARC5_9GAST|nr:hypothetical protein PoB_003599700 [Plakobranchus ocellatus]
MKSKAFSVVTLNYYRLVTISKRTARTPQADLRLSGPLSDLGTGGRGSNLRQYRRFPQIAGRKNNRSVLSCFDTEPVYASCYQCFYLNRKIPLW